MKNLAKSIADSGRRIAENRVIGSNGAGDQTDVYGFDLSGNRTGKQVFYDGNVNYASSYGSISYEYDAGGDDQLIRETAAFYGSHAGESYQTTYGHTTAGTFFKGYDANGSLIESHRTGSSATDISSSYDLRNRLSITSAKPQ